MRGKVLGRPQDHSCMGSCPSQWVLEKFCRDLSTRLLFPPINLKAAREGLSEHLSRPMSGEHTGSVSTFQRDIASGLKGTTTLQNARQAGRELPEPLSLTGFPELHGC